MTGKRKVITLVGATLGLLLSGTIGLGGEPTLAKLGFGSLKPVSAQKANSIRGKGGITISPITVNRTVGAYGTIRATQGASVNFAAIHGVAIERAAGVAFAAGYLADVQHSYGVGRTVSFTYPGVTLDKGYGYAGYGNLNY